MRKIIQPKRLNKNITVESYWQIRNKQKQTKKQLPYQAYREDEVANRYRYLKPTQQAKLFNPLAYFFKRTIQNKVEDEEYASNFKNQQFTYTHELLSSVRFRVSVPLIRIKKYIFGLKSIVYNHETIFYALLENLECQDSWPLTQAMIKDTKSQSFDFWMKKGLKMLAYQKFEQDKQPQSIYLNYFHQTRFQNLFDTLSIFMESNYDKIMQNLNEFFQIMNTYYFSHQNKYVRKFAMKNVSYIINNLSLEDNLKLIFNIVLNGTIVQKSEEIPIGQLLLNRHKAVKGCLSSVEINKVVETLKQVPLFLIKSFQNSEMNNQDSSFKQELQVKIQSILVVYIAGILDLLQTKFGRFDQEASSEILFDLNYCIKAIITLQQKAQSHLGELTLIRAFSKYLQDSDQKRFLTHNPKHQKYIDETFRLFLGYLQTSTLRIIEGEHLLKEDSEEIAGIVSGLLGFVFKISPKQSSKLVLSKGITHFCKILTSDQAFDLVQNIYGSEIHTLDSSQSQALGQFILLTFSHFIRNYFETIRSQHQNSQTTADLLYTISQILKKTDFNNSINMNYLSLQKNTLITKIQSIQEISEFILFCRLVSILNLQAQNNEQLEDNLRNNIENAFKRLITPFSESLKTLVNQDSKMDADSLFSYNSHIKNLLRYSHHEVEWVSIAFNLQDCYKQILKKLNCKKHPAKTQQKWIWQELSLNRTLKIDDSLNLQKIFSSSLNLLQSRNRLARKTILDRILQIWTHSSSNSEILKSILLRISSIDCQDIDLSNQRDVKKYFVLLEQQVSTLKNQNDLSGHIIKLLAHWLLGFSFSGFKLINESVVSFLSTILDLFPQQVGQIMFPFIEYYIYRHSRQFQYDTTQNQGFVLKTPKKVQKLFNQVKNRQIFYSLMKQDFSIQDLNTIQWIGLERIALAIAQAKKFKNKNLNVRSILERLLNSYFDEEFFRKNKQLSSFKIGQKSPNQHLILQPKTRFLIVMLKLCPNTYLPPYQCLHYVSAEYLGLESVHNIKKNRWEALWVKKLKGSKSKQQISDTVNTTIALDKMTIEEQKLYAHFLWKQIIQANQQKRRNLFQHIRDRISDIIPFMFEKLLFKEMLFLNEPSKYFQQVKNNPELITELKQKLLFENKKTLLNMMYVLKAMTVVFKNYLRNSVHLQNVVILLRCLTQIVYSNAAVINDKNDQNQIQGQKNENDQQAEVQDDDQEDQKQQEKPSAFMLYKPHRKQLYKVLTEMFTHYTLQYDQAESLLVQLSASYLSQNKSTQDSLKKNNNVFAKVAYATVNSVPGILILLKVISNQKFYHHLLLKFGILDLAASILDINDEIQISDSEQILHHQVESVHRKRQSNPHAVKQCLDLLSNFFNLKEEDEQSTKMQVENKKEVHHQKISSLKWKGSLENLLRSINHYFLHSRNLNENSLSGKSSGNIQLDYYSNQNKQNINSVLNNKNRNKGEQSKHDSEVKNLDVLWDVVAKIVTLRKQEDLSHQISLGQEWEQIFWTEINKIVKVKQFKERQHYKLFKIVQIALIYFDQQIQSSGQSQFSKKVDIEAFLCKIISVLPHINQLSQRVKLTKLIHEGISGSSKRQNVRLIDDQAVHTVSLINSVKRNGLNVQIDYDSFFSGLNSYCQANVNFKKSEQMIDQNKKQLNLLSHQYIIYNILPYLTSEELSVRKAIRQALNSFLVRISVHLRQFQAQTLRVYNSIIRLLVEQLKRNQIDSVFWSIFSCIGLFVRFQVKYSEKFSSVFENQNLYAKMMSSIVKNTTQNDKPLTFESESEDDFFHMVTSISQGNKMRALKMLKQHCTKLKGQGDYLSFKSQEKGCSLPHPLSWMLPLLQHLVLPVKHFVNQHQYNIQGNLTSTLTHISLEIYEVIMCFARQSLIKKQLKRLSTKIKYNESDRATEEHLKKNILVIKIISSIVQGIDTLEKCTGKVKNYVQQYGFEQFHSKLIQNARKLNQQAEQSDEDDEKKDDQKKKIQFGANLEQLQSQEAINRNFMMFDRKLMEMEEKQNQNSTANTQSALVKFLKLHILIPLKLMLFFEGKTNKKAKQEQDKSRMMISVAITKLLIKFPMEMFLFEFQKILSKICRLMKKRNIEVRQNGRKSLCQIAKIVGPEMLYAIVLELKFHLRDNFQKHIFNFTVYEIIQTLSPLRQGEIDYCLPLILPMVIDEMFGQASQEKKMVESGQVPVLNMQTKKKKGHELLIMLSRQVSVDRIKYMIDYLQKFLKEYLNSEVNLSKYDTMINHLTNGLGNNQQFTMPQNAGVFGQILCDSMYELRKQIKIYNFEEQRNKITHETTIKVNTQKSKKAGKQVLLLQQQAGRNGSIFKKMSKQVYEKRNQQIMINCLVQFYLALGSLLIKKQVLSLKTLQGNKQLTSNFIKIIQFVFECMDHRDNRIVSKSMRLLHQALIWNYEKSGSEELKQSTKSLRKKVSRKILLFIEKLTSTDEQLLKQSFVILIDLFSQVTVTKQFLPSIMSIIKLHTNNQNDQANIPEPYRLFKLIIYKVPECIYDPLIYEMYEVMRINIVNSNIREVRDVCKHIASTYVKSKQFLTTAIELGHQKEKNQKDGKSKQSKDKNVEAEYSQRIKKQLNFYLSNLDCKLEQNQLLGLDIIEELIGNRSKNQLQQVSQLVLLTLSTSVINGNEHIQKINTIISNILSIIDKTKINEILQKSLVWIAQSRQKAMIRQCGYFLLNSILSNKSVNLQNQTVKSQYFLKKDSTGLLSSIQTLLNEEVNILEDYLISKKNQHRGNKLQSKEWNGVLDAMDFEQDNPYTSENKILEYCISVLASLAQSAQYQARLKENHILSKVWQLLKIPKNTISEKAINFLLKINNLSAHLQIQKELSEDNAKLAKDQQEQASGKVVTFNYKSTIAALINNSISKQSILELIKKLQAEPTTGEEIYTLTFDLLMSFLNKIVMRFKIMESKTQHVYHLLNYGIIKNTQKGHLIFKQELNQNKIIDCLGKVARNQFVSVQCKVLNEQCINEVKQIIGVSDFYKKLTKFQSERREKKSEQKAHLATLAVTDQKAYIDAKKKKIKTQNH